MESGKCRTAALKRRVKFKNGLLWRYDKIEPWFVRGDRVAKIPQEITAVKVWWRNGEIDLQDDRGEWGRSGGAAEVEAYCEKHGIDDYQNDFCKDLVRPDSEGARVAAAEFDMWEYVPIKVVDHYPWSEIEAEETEDEKIQRWKENVVLFKVKWADEARILTDQVQGDTWEPEEKILDELRNEYFKNLKDQLRLPEPEHVALPQLDKTILEASFIEEEGEEAGDSE